MVSPVADQTFLRLEAAFGTGRGWTSQAGSSATAWETPAYHLLWSDDAASEREIRTLWEARQRRLPGTGAGKVPGPQEILLKGGVEPWHQ